VYVISPHLLPPFSLFIIHDFTHGWSMGLVASLAEPFLWGTVGIKRMLS
jgi:hypothetical protein